VAGVAGGGGVRVPKSLTKILSFSSVFKRSFKFSTPENCATFAKGVSAPSLISYGIGHNLAKDPAPLGKLYVTKKGVSSCHTRVFRFGVKSHLYDREQTNDPVILKK
jgi:hypothetical protein